MVRGGLSSLFTCFVGRYALFSFTMSDFDITSVVSTNYLKFSSFMDSSGCVNEARWLRVSRGRTMAPLSHCDAGETP